MYATANSRLAACCLVFGLLALSGPAALALDPEGCLRCHQYQGLARMDDDGKDVRLYHVNPNYYDRALGPHARLRCTGCHDRSEVQVVPHKPVSPVNCTVMCHLESSGQTETLFGHDTMMDALRKSVHNPDVLDESNRILGSPLRDGQARCLLCHDEPTWRRAGVTWADQQAVTQRCDVCHKDMLPQNTQYSYWHVYARTRPAWGPNYLVHACNICHGDDRIREHYDLSDATASYLESFHGKAMQLGDRSTAVCLDCHAPQMGNVHATLSPENPAAPTYPTHLPDTCRSAECHPSAGARLSSAAIHLDLGTSGGVEYFIGAVFVLLIVSTFGPSVVLQALELFHIVLGREDPHLHRRYEHAQELMAHPEGRQKLKRFTMHQRLQHWVLFASFTALVLTGFPLKFAERPWASWMIAQLGSLAVARVIHRIAGVVLMVGITYHLTYVIFTAWQKKRRTGKSLLRIAWELPMVARPEDLKYLLRLLGYLFFLRKERPEAGRFSLKEKFEYFGVFWGSVLLGVTGVLMWANAWTTQYLPGRALTIASLIHTFEAYLAFLHVGVIHVIGVFLLPSVFPMSRAMFTGDTPPEEMAEAHSAMLKEVSDELEGGPSGEVSRG